MKVHELKSWPAEFEAVRVRAKRFEIRCDDRGFEKGDIVILREFRPAPDDCDGEPLAAGYTERTAGPFRIGYIERSSCLPQGWCGFEIHRMVVEGAGPAVPQERIADALEILSSAVDLNRNTIAIDDLSRER